MKIIDGAENLPTFNYKQWQDSSQKRWEQSFLDAQLKYSPSKSEEHSTSSTEGHYNEVDHRYQPGINTSFNSHTIANQEAAFRGIAATKESQVVSEARITYSMHRYSLLALNHSSMVKSADYLSKSTPHQKQTQTFPSAASPLSRGTLHKDQYGNATLWVGNVNEGLFKRNLGKLAHYLEIFSIKLTRVFFRGREISLDGHIHPFESNQEGSRLEKKHD